MIINITPSTLSSASHIDRSSNDASTTNRRERDTTIPVLGLCGSLYEWFDFASFASMSPEIGAAFFPKENAQKQLLYTLLIFSMSFILHPLGALIFGEIADNGHLNSSMAQVLNQDKRSEKEENRISRNLNRTRALLLSFVSALLPTLVLVFLPDYNSIGKSSQYLLVALRVLQGIAVGGQSPGCHVLAIATSKFQNRGFRGSLCHAVATLGYLLANAVVAVVRHVDSDGEWEGHWRVPFFVSILFLLPMIAWLYDVVNSTEQELTALYVRHYGDDEDEDDSSRDLSESFSKSTDTHSVSVRGDFVRQVNSRSKLFQNLMYRRRARALERKRNKKLAIKTIFKDRSLTQKLLGHTMTVGILTASFNLLVIFVPLYISEMTEIINTRMASVWTFITLFFYIIVVLISGRWNDSNPPRIQGIVLGMIGVITVTPLMLLSIETRVPSTIFFSMIVHAAVLAFGYSGCASWQVELWRKHPKVTYTGVALGHNLSGCIFGGTLPVLGLYFANRRIDRYCEKWNVSLMECYEAMSLNHYFPLYSLGTYIVTLGAASLVAILFIAHHPKTARFLNWHYSPPPSRTELNLQPRPQPKSKPSSSSSQNLQLTELASFHGFHKPPALPPPSSFLPPAPLFMTLSTETILTEFFEASNPKKIKDVARLSKKYTGREDKLYSKLTAKYNLPPTYFKEAAKEPCAVPGHCCEHCTCPPSAQCGCEHCVCRPGYCEFPKVPTML